MQQKEEQQADPFKPLTISYGENSKAELYAYGGHLAKLTLNGENILYLSGKSFYEAPKAIRGGVPICFPQFGPQGPLQQHGFARNLAWRVLSHSEKACSFQLSSHENSQVRDTFGWQEDFTLTTTFEFSSADALRQSIKVVASGSTPLTFQLALHTYFELDGGIEQTSVLGLKRAQYLNQLTQQVVEDEQDVLIFDQEVDKIYYGTAQQIILQDNCKRIIKINKSPELEDLVVFNPWIEKSKRIPDIELEDYKHFCCLEAARIRNRVTLQPGQEWTASQTISLEQK